MRTKTAILSSALLLGALAVAAIVVATIAGGGGSAASNTIALATSAPGLFKSESGLNSAPASTTSLDAGAAPLPASAPDSSQTTTANGTATGGTITGGTSSVSNSLVDRKIERQATLDITVDDVAGAVSRIEAAAGGAGGFISQEMITQATTTSGANDTKRQQATVQIRVPAEKYTAVMNDLRGLAKEVTSENSQTSEVTGQYTDLQSQLRNLQSTEQQYLTLMGTATTVGDILTVQDRLNSVQGQIEQVQGQIQLLDNLTAMATITIDVSLPALPATTEPPEESWAAEAWSNAWDTSQQVMRALGTGAITAGVVFVWVLIPGMAALGAWRLFGTRRKQNEVPSA
jgi:hypothetical protein